jgi:hypothetical protein
LIFVSAAFGLIAIRTILLKLDLFIPEMESSLLEFLLAVMGFTPLALFFFAIVKREKVKTKIVRSLSQLTKMTAIILPIACTVFDNLFNRVLYPITHAKKIDVCYSPTYVLAIGRTRGLFS